MYVWFDMCFTAQLRIFHLYDCPQHYGQTKTGSMQGKPTNICRFLSDLPTYDRGGTRPELELTATVLVGGS